MAAAAETAPEPPDRIGGAGVLAAGAMGAAVAIALGLYGNAHDPQTDLAITLGFADTITMKVWLTTIAVLFALLQVFTALWMYGRLPFASRPPWLAKRTGSPGGSRSCSACPSPTTASTSWRSRRPIAVADGAKDRERLKLKPTAPVARPDPSTTLRSTIGQPPPPAADPPHDRQGDRPPAGQRGRRHPPLDPPRGGCRVSQNRGGRCRVAGRRGGGCCDGVGRRRCGGGGCRLGGCRRGVDGSAAAGGVSGRPAPGRWVL